MDEPFARPCLCLVTDRALGGETLQERVEACVAAGVDLVQVRARELGGAELLAHTEALLAAARRGAGARSGRVRVVVNRRVDVALAAGADGVHLGFDGMAPGIARRLLPAGAAIGVATHAPVEVERARASGATYAHLAPVFDPISKPAEREALGLIALAEAARSGLPVLAQGGITALNAGDCLRAGAAGVAVTGALLSGPDAASAARALREALDRA